MLNKGRHMVEAIGVLDRILERTAGHLAKRSPRLPKLRAWRQYAVLAPLRQPPQGLAGAPGLREALAAGTSRIESISE